MSILLHPWDDPDRWRSAFDAELPDHPIQLWPDVHDVDAVRYAIVGRHEAADLQRYPNLAAILALSAGIEHFRSPDYPDVPIVRLADPTMSNEMAAYVAHWIVYFQKGLDRYRAQQRQARWQPVEYAQAEDYRVGILGYGTIGARIAEVLADLDFRINGWSRTGRDDGRARQFIGEAEMGAFLAASDAVVNVLPSTQDTGALMNADRFAQMKPGAVYVSIGRGRTTDAGALVAALDAGHLHAAVLDVTKPEPLPPESPLWAHPQVHITPHIAGYTIVRSAARVVAANIRRIEVGEAPFPIYDRQRGY